MNTKTRTSQSSVGQRAVDGFVVTSRGRATYTSRDASDSFNFAEKKPVSSLIAKAVSPHKMHTQPAAVVPKNAHDYDIPQFDMPRYTAPERPPVVVTHRKAWKRALANVGAVLGLLLVVSGSYMFWQGYVNLHKVFSGTGTVAALTSQRVAPELLDGEGDGRVNILLLGIGGASHPGGDLTDTIVVMSIDPVNNTAAMLSVPRDLWVKMPVNYFGGYQKINAAYSSGKYSYLGRTDLVSNDAKAIQAGFNSIDEAVGAVLGIRINYHVLVNFEAFREAVNTVQGVTVDVSSPLYDPSMAWENNNNPLLASTGLQTMDGKQALNYARSRKTSSDFQRSERQRELLVALKDRVLTLGTLSSPTKITGLMDTLGKNIHTDLSTQAATRLFTIMNSIDDSRITSLSLTEPKQLVATGRIGDTSIVQPVAGLEVYSDIQDYVRSQLRDGYLVQENAPVYVAASNEAQGAAVAQTLALYGYNVKDAVVSENLPTGTSVVDMSDGKAPYTKHYLQDRYANASFVSLPEGLDVPSGTEFVILIGK